MGHYTVMCISNDNGRWYISAHSGTNVIWVLEDATLTDGMHECEKAIAQHRKRMQVTKQPVDETAGK